MRNRKTVGGIACALALAAVLGGCTPELVFSPATLPDGQVGAPYAATITVSQVETPVDNVVEGGALPPGLDLKWDKQTPNTFQSSYAIHISGTPTVAGTFSFSIEVDCLGRAGGGQIGDHGYTLVVK